MKMMARRKGRIWRRIFAMLLAMALLSTAVPVDVRGSQIDGTDVAVVSQNDILEESGATADSTAADEVLPGETGQGGGTLHEDASGEMPSTQAPAAKAPSNRTTPMVPGAGAAFFESSLVTANGNDINALAEDKPMAIANNADLLGDDTSVDLVDIYFIVEYDENGQHHKDTIKMSDVDKGEITIPKNAKITLEFHFNLGHGDNVHGDTRYRYKIPPGINIDFETTKSDIPLEQPGGKPDVGKAHIVKDSDGGYYIEFEFYDDVVDGYDDINFDVWFSGSLSGDGLNDEGNLEMEFPAQGGGWTVEGKIEEPAQQEKSVNVSKGASQNLVTGPDGKQYIEWTISLTPGSAEDVLNGTIVDTLPDGLKYVEGSMRVSNTNKDGSYTPRVVCDGDIIYIYIDEKDGIQQNNSWSPISFTFWTEYTFEGEFNDNGITYVNNAKYEPKDDDVKTNGPQNGTFTLNPNLVEKAGEMNADGTITWTVTINRDKMNIGGATYTDTIIGDWFDGFAGDITYTPAEPRLTINKTGNGFNVEFPPNYNQEVTFTYTTTVKSDFEGNTFTNKADLKKPGEFNVGKTATVTDTDLIDKAFGHYNAIEQTLTWTITVNPGGEDLKNVKVTEDFSDLFPGYLGPQSNWVEIVSATYDDGRDLLSGADKNGNKVTFDLGDVSRKREITVVLKLTDAFNSWLAEHPDITGLNFTNKTNITATKNGRDVTDHDSATTWVPNVQKPDYIEKSGKSLGDGTIEWTITVHNHDNVITDMTISDRLPEGLEYVPGSMFVRSTWSAAEEPGGVRYVDDTKIWTDGKELNYPIYQNGRYVADFPEAWVKNFRDQWSAYFEIVFRTKPTGNPEDIVDGAHNGKTYVNTADFDAVIDGGNVHEEETAKVDQPAGGILKKDIISQNKRDIVWEVTINEGRYDLGTNLTTITDTLEDCYMYVSGDLYIEDEEGHRTVVPQGNPAAGDFCNITVVNNQIVVQLPAIRDRKFVFQFMTTFVVSQGAMDDYLPLQNTVEFKGIGNGEQAKSGRIENVDFSEAGGSGKLSRGIRIVKVDGNDIAKVLAGAVFDLYEPGEDGKPDRWLGTVTTDENGRALFDMDLKMFLGKTLKLKESTPPYGYTEADAGYPEGYEPIGGGEYGIYIEITEAVIANDILEIQVTNKPEEEEVKTASIKLRKVDKDENTSVLSGAVFEWYNAADPTKKYTSTTNASGEITINDLEEGTYYLTEITPPKGHKLGTNPMKIKVVIDEVGDELVVAYFDITGGEPGTQMTPGTGGSVTVVNEKAKGSLTITKQNENGGPLTGARFGLYEDAACTRLIEEKTTGPNGTVTFDNLELGKTYWYKETVAPNGYVLDDTPHSFVVGKETDTADQNKPITVTNKLAVGNLVIDKYDEKGNMMRNAVFGLWVWDDTILPSGDWKEYVPSGSTGQYTVTTNTRGEARFENLPFGKYQVRESGAPTGYDYEVISEDVTIEKLGDTHIEINNKLVTAKIQLTKYGELKEDAEHPTHTLSNVYFKLVSSDGKTVVATGTTDQYGQLTFPAVPYGRYHIVEDDDRVPEGYDRPTTHRCSGSVKNCVADIELTDFNGAGNGIVPIIPVSVVNIKQNGSVLILKTATSTNGAVTGLRGAKFILVDEDGNQVGDEKTSGDITGIDLSDVPQAFKDAVEDGSWQDGLVYFTGLPYGTYYLRETMPPVGYIDDGYEYKIVIDNSDTVVVTYIGRKDSDGVEAAGTGDLIINNTEQEPPVISVKLQKRWNSGQNSNSGNLEDAQFELYKVLPDNGGTVHITSVSSDEDGMVYFRRIRIDDDPTGTKYYIREVSAPGGYHASTSQAFYLGQKYATGEGLGSNDNIGKYVDAKNGNQDVPLDPVDVWWLVDAEKAPVAGETAPESVASSAVWFNEVVYGAVRIRKSDPNTATRILSGAQYTIYYDRECKYVVGSATATNPQIEEYVNRDKLLPTNFSATAETNEESIALFTGLPQGRYFIRESKAPKGYKISTEIREVEVTVDRTTTITYNMLDERLNIHISKRIGNVNGEELVGAEFSLYELGAGDTLNIIRTFKGGSNWEIPFQLLEAGKTYRLVETKAPAGYTYAPNVSFQVDANGQITNLQSSDMTAVGTDDDKMTLVVVDKPISVSIVKLDENNGALQGASLALYKMVDNQEVLVRTYTTQGKPIEIAKELEIPAPTGAGRAQWNRYILREITAPAGYDIAEDIVFEVSSAGEVIQVDPSGAVLGSDQTWTITMKDQLLENFYFEKRDSSSGDRVAGATFTLFESDEKGTPVPGGLNMQWTSESTSARKFPGASVDPGDNSALVLGKTYTLKETNAPAGYILPNPDEITFEVISGEDGRPKLQLIAGRGNVNTNISRDGHTIIMRDIAVRLSVLKEDAVTAKPLAGAHLAIYEFDPSKPEPEEGKQDERLGKNLLEGLCEGGYFVSSGEGAVELTAEIPGLAGKLQVGEGHWYALVEVEPPANYVSAPMILFYFSQAGVVMVDGVGVRNNTLVMVDDPNGINIAKVDLADNETRLLGCTLELNAKDPAENMIFRGPHRWTSGENGQNVWSWKMLNFTPGETYVLSEIGAPDGYAYTVPIEFWVDEDYQVYIGDEPQPGNLVKIADGALVLNVSKQDYYTGEEVPGATLAIYHLDADGNIEDENDPWATWTTGKTTKDVDTSRLKAGGSKDGPEIEEYILREIKAPDGYYTAEDIHFGIDSNGDIYLYDADGNRDTKPVDGQKLIMREMPMFSIKKLDTQGNYVAGAELQITEKDSKTVIDTWVTTDTGHFYDLAADNPFEAGVTYVLQETKAPKGYTYANSVEFMINENNELFVGGERVESMQIVMLDRPLQVYINKVDAGSGQGLTGAKLAIKDDSGKVIHSFESTGEPILLPSDLFTAPPAGYIYLYTLTEVEAPSGYSLAKDIVFGIDSDGNVLLKENENTFTKLENNTVVMKDVKTEEDPDNPPSKVTNPLAPKTGDDTPLAMMILLCIVGFVGACSNFVKYLKRRRRHV
ncbi:MAG: hypothetical protein J1E61_03990 [Lachnospiraceae bacterium]|nr:hypothetical protein [Lachnospiraceae bacterium]